MLKIKKNVPVSKEEHTRKVWPFTKMKVGDVVEVKDASEWEETLKYAHVIAGKKKWKMQGVWIGAKGIGRIRRVV